MARKRKVPASKDAMPPPPPPKKTAIHKICMQAQLNDSSHNKFLKELIRLYPTMEHDTFMDNVIQITGNALLQEETHEYANRILQFVAKFLTSLNKEEDTHPALSSIFNWLLSKSSKIVNVRFRMCQFVNVLLNTLGPEAALDDFICDGILKYMLEELKDSAFNVRVQAILALQRLQLPDNPDDIITKTYIFHLNADPSPKVRQAVISSIARNFYTMPYILERLWDIDERVRRHTYLQMSSYPVRAYKVAQRLTLLEQGLNDHSEMVRKVVVNVMLIQWYESYGKNLLAFISGLKLDANETEVERFYKTAVMALKQIFKKRKLSEIIDQLPIDCVRLTTVPESDENDIPVESISASEDMRKCIPLDKLTIEMAILWQAVVEYLNEEISDDLDSVLPDLITFCKYARKFCEFKSIEMDKWAKIEHTYIVISLIEIAGLYDLGDEIGRESLRGFLEYLLVNNPLGEKAIKKIATIMDHLIPAREERLQFFVDIIRRIEPSANGMAVNCMPMESVLIQIKDKELQLKLSAMKVKILDLKEQETDLMQKKDYANAQIMTEALNMLSDEYNALVQPYLANVSLNSGSVSKNELTGSSSVHETSSQVMSETILKCLQISFFMLHSPKVSTLTPATCELFTDFIRRHIESSQIIIRDWALQSATSFSMLYEPFAKDVYKELYTQFYKNHNIRIWRTSIKCVFELLERYGLTYFDLSVEKQNKSKKTGRQLYTTLTEYPDQDEEGGTPGNGVDLMFLMAHFLDTCEDSAITAALIEGYCRLVLRGIYNSNDIVSKLLLKFFNPTTEPEINQMIGIFFETMITKHKQECLQPALLPTLTIIFEAPYDSPLLEIKAETIMKFVIDSTRPIYSSPGLNIHNTMAMSFLQTIIEQSVSKEMTKLLSKSLLNLEISEDTTLRNDLIKCADNLVQGNLEPRTIKNIVIFKSMLDGTYKGRISFSSTGVRTANFENADPNRHGSDGEEGTCNESNLPANLSTENILNSTPSPLAGPKSPKEQTSTAQSTSKSPFEGVDSTELRYLRKSQNPRPMISSDEDMISGKNTTENSSVIFETPKAESDSQKSVAAHNRPRRGVTTAKTRKMISQEDEFATEGQSGEQTHNLEVVVSETATEPAIAVEAAVAAVTTAPTVSVGLRIPKKTAVASDKLAAVDGSPNVMTRRRLPRGKVEVQTSKILPRSDKSSKPSLMSKGQRDDKKNANKKDSKEIKEEIKEEPNRSIGLSTNKNTQKPSQTVQSRSTQSNTLPSPRRSSRKVTVEGQIASPARIENPPSTSTPNVRTPQQPSTSKNSAVNQMRVRSSPVVRLIRLNMDSLKPGHRTRSAVRADVKMNNIMTRHSLDILKNAESSTKRHVSDDDRPTTATTTLNVRTVKKFTKRVATRSAVTETTTKDSSSSKK